MYQRAFTCDITFLNIGKIKIFLVFDIRYWYKYRKNAGIEYQKNTDYSALFTANISCLEYVNETFIEA